MKKIKFLSILLCISLVFSLFAIPVFADNNTSLTVNVTFTGDPPSSLTPNARVRVAGGGKTTDLLKGDLLKGSKIVNDLTSGTYDITTKNIQREGYSVKMTLNGVEANSIDIDLNSTSVLDIDLCYEKIEFKNLPCVKLNADKETDFYNPVYGGYDTTFQDNDSLDDSERLQAMIDDVSNSGGGIITIKSGDYYVSEIALKSNVHIKTEANVTFHIGDATPVNEKTELIKKGNMFRLTGDDDWITNVSFEALNPKEKYVIDLDTKKYDSTFGFSCGAVNNFKISDAKILGDYKAYQKISVGGGKVGGVSVVATSGVISDIDCYNTIYGYGLIQIQAGKDILFKNLYGEGGVTLRIENGFIQYEGENTQRVNGIYGRNIKCENGHFAFMCADHGIPIGYFDVQNLYAKSCVATASIGSGNTDSILRDVKAVYGEKAQLKSKDLYKLPLALKNSVVYDENDPGNIKNGGINPDGTDARMWIGPSVAPVLLEGDRVIDFSEKDVTQCDGFDKKLYGESPVYSPISISMPDGGIIEPALFKLTGLEKPFAYTGKEIIPDIHIEFDGKPLVQNEDYVISCENNINEGTANIRIDFARKYLHFYATTFKISKSDLSAGECSYQNIKIIK